jgi:hypothetical protein
MNIGFEVSSFFLGTAFKRELYQFVQKLLNVKDCRLGLLGPVKVDNEGGGMKRPWKQILKILIKIKSDLRIAIANIWNQLK